MIHINKILSYEVNGIKKCSVFRHVYSNFCGYRHLVTITKLRDVEECDMYHFYKTDLVGKMKFIKKFRYAKSEYEVKKMLDFWMKEIIKEIQITADMVTKGDEHFKRN